MPLILLLFTAVALAGAGVAGGAAQGVPAPDTARYGASPHDLFDGLFSAVQSARIYADGKTFADADPLTPPAQILAEYRAQRPEGVDALRAFIDTRFRLPGEAVTSAGAALVASGIAAHID